MLKKRIKRLSVFILVLSVLLVAVPNADTVFAFEYEDYFETLQTGTCVKSGTSTYFIKIKIDNYAIGDSTFYDVNAGHWDGCTDVSMNEGNNYYIDYIEDESRYDTQSFHFQDWTYNYSGTTSPVGLSYYTGTDTAPGDAYCNIYYSTVYNSDGSLLFDGDALYASGDYYYTYGVPGSYDKYYIYPDWDYNGGLKQYGNIEFVKCIGVAEFDSNNGTFTMLDDVVPDDFKSIVLEHGGDVRSFAKITPPTTDSTGKSVAYWKCSSIDIRTKEVIFEPIYDASVVTIYEKHENTADNVDYDYSYSLILDKDNLSEIIPASKYCADGVFTGWDKDISELKLDGSDVLYAQYKRSSVDVNIHYKDTNCNDAIETKSIIKEQLWSYIANKYFNKYIGVDKTDFPCSELYGNNITIGSDSTEYKDESEFNKVLDSVVDNTDIYIVYYEVTDITAKDTNLTIQNGDNAVFEVTTKGEDVHYQWYAVEKDSSSWYSTKQETLSGFKFDSNSNSYRYTTSYTNTTEYAGSHAKLGRIVEAKANSQLVLNFELDDGYQIAVDVNDVLRDKQIIAGQYSSATQLTITFPKTSTYAIIIRCWQESDVTGFASILTSSIDGKDFWENSKQAYYESNTKYLNDCYILKMKEAKDYQRDTMYSVSSGKAFISRYTTNNIWDAVTPITLTPIGSDSSVLTITPSDKYYKQGSKFICVASGKFNDTNVYGVFYGIVNAPNTDLLTLNVCKSEKLVAKYNGDDVPIGANYSKDDVEICIEREMLDGSIQSEIVTDYEVDSTLVDNKGDNIFTVTYNGETANFTVIGYEIDQSLGFCVKKDKVDDYIRWVVDKDKDWSLLNSFIVPYTYVSCKYDAGSDTTYFIPSVKKDFSLNAIQDYVAEGSYGYWTLCPKEDEDFNIEAYLKNNYGVQLGTTINFKYISVVGDHFFANLTGNKSYTFTSAGNTSSDEISINGSSLKPWSSVVSSDTLAYGQSAPFVSAVLGASSFENSNVKEISKRSPDIQYIGDRAFKNATFPEIESSCSMSINHQGYLSGFYTNHEDGIKFVNANSLTFDSVTNNISTFIYNKMRGNILTKDYYLNGSYTMSVPYGFYDMHTTAGYSMHESSFDGVYLWSVKHIGEEAFVGTGRVLYWSNTGISKVVESLQSPSECGLELNSVLSSMTMKTFHGRGSDLTSYNNTPQTYVDSETREYDDSTRKWIGEATFHPAIEDKIFWLYNNIYTGSDLFISDDNAHEDLFSNYEYTVRGAVNIPGSEAVSLDKETKYRLYAICGSDENGNVDVITKIKSLDDFADFKFSTCNVHSVGNSVPYATYNYKMYYAEIPASITATYADDDVYVGEDVVKEKLTVIATYSDGTIVTLNSDDYEFIGDTAIKTLGENEFTVEYLGVQGTFTVNGIEKEIKNMSAIYTGNSIELGKQYDAADVTVTLTYVDDTTRVLAKDEFTVDKTTVTLEGDNTFSAMYTTLSATFVVEGYKQLLSINAEYLGGPVEVGKSYNTSDVKVTATYSGGISEVIQSKNCTFGKTEVTVVGSNEFNVLYNGQSSKFTVQGIKSANKTISSMIVTYTGDPVEVGKSYDRTKLTVVLKYTDDTTERLDQSKLILDSTVVTKEGLNTFTAKYSTITSTFTVTGLGDSSSIVVKYTGDDKLVGSVVEKSEFSVIPTNMGTIISTVISPNDISVVGTNPVKVTVTDINNKKASAIIGVWGYQLENISAKYVGPDIKVGNKYDPDNVEITLKYSARSDGNSDTVMIRGSQAADLDLNITKVGPNDFSVSYKSGNILKSTSYEVNGFVESPDTNGVENGDVSDPDDTVDDDDDDDDDEAENEVHSKPDIDDGDNANSETSTSDVSDEKSDGQEMIKTGDTTTILPYAISAIILLFGIVITIIALKKKHKYE